MRASSVALRAGARGLTAAMTMSGARQLSTNLGLMDETPPETVVKHAEPLGLATLDPGRRGAVTELAHWAYGAAGGVAYGLLPRSVRRRRLTGPVYGLSVWLAFEIGIAPLLGAQHPQGRVAGRVMLMLDHALYGAIVSGWFAPEPEVIESR